jgi:hypothetical protein
MLFLTTGFVVRVADLLNYYHPSAIIRVFHSKYKRLLTPPKRNFSAKRFSQ